MSSAYFDCFAGVSGDMILGALTDLGLDIQALESLLNSLGISLFSITFEHVNHKGIQAVDLRIETKKGDRPKTLRDILKIIDSPVLSGEVKEKIARIFTRIAEAESKVHHKPVNQVHFHEVGAVDSMIDIIGSVWGIEQLGISECYCSPISIGSGSVVCEHGTIPVPSPATLELIKGFPVIKKEVGAELATPTGTAVVTTIAKYAAQLPPMRIANTGYGCGDRELVEFPNVLRIIKGEPVSSYAQDSVLVVETNLDDMNTEQFPYVMEQLFEQGAADVFITPVIMKKGRPGHKITLLVAVERLDGCLHILFRESTTLGVRIYEAHRRKLERTAEIIDTPWGTVKVKSYIFDGKKQIVPEYEECKKIAAREHLPLREIYDAIKQIGNPVD